VAIYEGFGVAHMPRVQKSGHVGVLIGTEPRSGTSWRLGTTLMNGPDVVATQSAGL
jgi:hypothetical protein